MAIDIYSIDQLYPTFTGNETNAEKIAMIMDYLYKLIESLKYTLYHLDEGNFSEGMSEYVTGKAMDEELKDYAKEEELADYVTDGELATELQPYAKKSDLNDYVTNKGLDDELAGYAKKSDLGGYVTDAELTTALTPYATTSAVNTALGYYLPRQSPGDIALAATGSYNVSIQFYTNSGEMQITAPGGLFVNGTRIA